MTRYGCQIDTFSLTPLALGREGEKRRWRRGERRGVGKVLEKRRRGNEWGDDFGYGMKEARKEVDIRRGKEMDT